jgi:hypothetical protein
MWLLLIMKIGVFFYYRRRGRVIALERLKLLFFFIF